MTPLPLLLLTLLTMTSLDVPAQCSVNRVPFEWRADSGANLNLFYPHHWQDYKSALLKAGRKVPKLYPSKDVRTAGQETLKIAGRFKATLTSPNSKKGFESSVYVCSSPTQDVGRLPLLGRQAMQGLGFAVYDPRGGLHFKSLTEGATFDEDLFDDFDDKEADRIIHEELNAEMRALRDQIHEKFKHIFTGQGRYNGPPVHVEVTDDFQPHTVPARPTPIHIKQKLIDQLKVMIKEGIFSRLGEDESYDHCSPLHVVMKKNGDLRITSDFSHLNNFVKRYRHLQTPRIDDFQAKLCDGKWYFVLDMSNSYHMIPVTPESSRLLVVSTPIGNLKYNVLGQGLNMSGDAFDSIMNDVLDGLDGVVNYRDDVIGTASTFEGLMSLYEKVLARLAKNGLHVNPAKTQISQTVKFFGMIWEKGSMRPDPEKVRDLRATSPPEDKKAMLSFLSCVQWLSSFIPHLAEKTALLRDMTHKNADYSWTDERLNAFYELRDGLSDKTMLNMYDPRRETAVFVDAGKLSHQRDPTTRNRLRGGLAGVLCQMIDGEWAPISFYSRRISEVMSRYDQLSLESCAILWSCRKFAYYLLGCPAFTVFTDSKPLLPFYNRKKINHIPPRIHRHMLELQNYNLKVKWTPGIYQMTDFLSRNPSRNISAKFAAKEEDLLISEVTAELESDIRNELLAETGNDDVLSFVKHVIENNKWTQAKSDPRLKTFYQLRSDLSVIDGLVYNGSQVVVPTSMHKRLVKKFHDVYEHQGRDKTYMKLKSMYWFVKLSDQVAKTIAACSTCQRIKFCPRKDPEGQRPTVPQFNYQVAMDYKDLPNGKQGLVMMCLWSRYAKVYQVKSTAFEYAKPALDDWRERFGDSYIWISDNGPPFNGVKYQSYCKQNGITHDPVTPINPQGNGEIEGFMRTISRAIKVSKLENRNFVEVMKNAVAKYNDTPHITTGVSPFEIVFGRPKRNGMLDPRGPEAFSRPPPSDATIRERIEKVKTAVQEKRNEKRHVKPHQFAVGDKVWGSIDGKTYDPVPYVIIEIRHDSIVAARESDGKHLHRRAEFFKKVVEDDEAARPPRNELGEDRSNRNGRPDLIQYDLGDDDDLPPGGGGGPAANDGGQPDNPGRGDRRSPGGRARPRNNRRVVINEDGNREYVIPSRPRTRGQGPVPDFPNVLPVPPEYSAAARRDLVRIREQFENPDHRREVDEERERLDDIRRGDDQAEPERDDPAPDNDQR